MQFKTDRYVCSSCINLQTRGRGEERERGGWASLPEISETRNQKSRTHHNPNQLNANSESDPHEGQIQYSQTLLRTYQEYCGPIETYAREAISLSNSKDPDWKVVLKNRTTHVEAQRMEEMAQHNLVRLRGALVSQTFRSQPTYALASRDEYLNSQTRTLRRAYKTRFWATFHG